MTHWKWIIGGLVVAFGYFRFAIWRGNRFIRAARSYRCPFR